MNLTKWLEIVSKSHYDSPYMLCMATALVYQILLWVGLVRLHIDLKREDIYWEECTGKIRSAYTRKMGSEEELDVLHNRTYAPIVDRLVAINFAEANSATVDRYLLLSWKAKSEMCAYLIRWLRLFVSFLVVAWFMSYLSVMADNGLDLSIYQVTLLWAWLVYAMRLAQKQVSIWRGLERVQQGLLLPYYD